ncbi:MAG: hypothetical protein A2W08_10235 [Candidatus Rokubacteria bacterium RBG_16_73_20]|nr:MAG: hypothetical protein A2050_09170 [Candidatus Rokubacteria bacterium GWA2_73_35]OGK91883.1 MAG: hypothetical protein A2W08_10235 [Candidatus Rokubacteria bacterium RBG_16_73_20]HBH03500.1 hypothetical protein [Candidatus Rokubacteria bacterium]
MEHRELGRTGLAVSLLGFGCGNVGGLLVRGTPAVRERAVARAVELGVNYFDTAPLYGDGRSEEHLGQVLRALRPAVYVGTKVRLAPAELGNVPGAIARSLEASLRRLGLERVDLLQLHNPILASAGGRGVPVATVLDAVLPTLVRLREQGKLRFLGVSALGESGAVHRALEARGLDTAQVCYNLLNPSAGAAVPAGFPAQDFGGLLGRARAHGVGVIVVRALAGGALSGALERHPIAVPTLEPIASGPDYATDVERARRLDVLVREGHAASVVEAALRFAAAGPGVSTVLVGCSSLAQLEEAAQALARGPLPPAALERLAEAWRGFVTGS